MMLIVETITWKPHIETAMEIALCERDAGREVVYCNLRSGLPICEDGMRSHVLIDVPGIRIRRSRAVLEKHGIRYLSPAAARADRAVALAQAEALMSGLDDLDAVKTLAWKDFSDLGWSVISSAVSMTQNPCVSPRTHRHLFVPLCASALLVYQRTRALIDELAPSEVMLFNGRFATTRAVIRAAEASDVPWRMHERGGDWHRYWTADFLPQDQDRVQAQIRSQWRDEHAATGHRHFQLSRQRVERAWHSYTKSQQLGELPAEMQEAGEWVTFFTSSDDEMVGAGPSWQSTAFPAQLDAVQAVAEAVSSFPNMRLCIRVHPHIAQKGAANRRRWANLPVPGTLVVGPSDPCDSYALIERSHVVCSFGSTIGVEATYWRRPSLLLSRSFYDRLNVCQQAENVAQIRAFLADPVVFPIEGALQYGAYFEYLGEPYKYYQPDNFHRGRICGVYLDDTLTVRAARVVVGLLRQ